MPSPVTPDFFKDLIPRLSSSLCGKFVPTITNFIRRFVDFYEWMFNEDGSFTDNFKADICALGCTAVGPCPTLETAPTLVGLDTEVQLSWVVSGPVPYDYELFRAESPSGPWTSILADTGITDTSLELVDDASNDITTAPSNDTTYYYKLVVEATGCDPSEYITGGVTPKACYVNGNDFSIALTQGETAITIALGAASTTPIPDGTTVNIWRSTTPDSVGTQIVTGAAFAGGSYSYADSGLTVGTRYYYTAKVQQSGGCTEYTLTANAYATTLAPVGPPQLTLENGILSWPLQTGITGYYVVANSHYGGGSEVQLPDGDLPLPNGVPLGVLKVTDVTPNRWQSNLNALGYNKRGGSYAVSIKPGYATPIPPILPGSEAALWIQPYLVGSGTYASLEGYIGKSYQIVVIGINQSTGTITKRASINFAA